MDLPTLVALCASLLGAGAYIQRMNSRIDALEKRVDQLGDGAGHPQGDLIAKVGGILALVAGVVVLLLVLADRLP